MVLCTEEISSGSEPNSRAVIVHPAEGSTDEAPHSETEQMIADSPAHASQSDHEGASPSATPPKMSEGSDRDSSVVRLAQEGKNTSMTSERALQPSQKGALSLPHGQGGISPSGKAEKASEDGYNWRKYGQKNVKGNEFIRSYYKCTHSNCLVKKQVERSLEGQITDTLYFGQHDHPKPHINVPQTIGLVLSIVEEKAEKHSSAVIEEKSSENRGQTCQQVKTTETPLSPVVIASADVKSTTLLSPRSRLRDEAENGDDPSSKRKKKENRSVDAASVDKATGESRFTIQTKSEVDIVNDGHRWRKYGQKLVKGNPNPRSYYRCSSPGCPAKKHVERASHDPKVVMTTYEGQHDHGIPTARNVISNPAGTDSATVVQSVEARTKSEEGAAVSADAAVREEISNRPSELTEQQNDESANKCDETRSSTSERESKSKELQKGEPPSPCKSHGETGNPSDSVPKCRLNEEQSNSQSTAKMEEIQEGCLNKLGKKPNEQQEVLSTAAAVPS